MVGGTGGQNTRRIRWIRLAESVVRHNQQPAHHPRHEHCSRRLRSPGTHQPTQRDGLDTRRGNGHHRHMPTMRPPSHQHATGRRMDMPALQMARRSPSHQSHPRQQTLATRIHRKTSRSRKIPLQNGHPLHKRPDPPMAHQRQTPRHADKTQRRVRVQPRRNNRHA